MTIERIVDLLTGQFGALVLSLMMIYFTVKSIKVVALWIDQKLTIWVERHLSQIDQMLKESKADRDMYQTSMIKILEQFDVIEDRIVHQGKQLERIEQKIGKKLIDN
jgi:hypothetical protein